MVAEMLQKQKFIWCENQFSFSENNSVFNKIYFIISPLFQWYQNNLLFNENRFVFNKMYFHHIIFFHDIKICFYSVMINLYSTRNILIIYIFFHSSKIFLIYMFFTEYFSAGHIWSSICIYKSQNFTFSM